MHINTVFIDGIWVKYNLESVKGEITITADFVKGGESLQKIYNISTLSKQGAHMVAALLDDEFAVTHARNIMAESAKSKHSKLVLD